MEDQLKNLDSLNKTNTKDWPIKLSDLQTPERGKPPYADYFDHFFESTDLKYACLFYTVIEHRMNAYSGLIAIYENNEYPKLLLSSPKIWFDYDYKRTVTFDQHYLFLRKELYNHDEPSLSGFPFVIFDFEKKVFCFLDFDYTGCYYSPIHKIDSTYSLKLDYPDEQKLSNKKNRDKETFQIKNLIHYPFDLYADLEQLYWNEKRPARSDRTTN